MLTFVFSRNGGGLGDRLVGFAAIITLARYWQVPLDVCFDHPEICEFFGIPLQESPPVYNFINRNTQNAAYEWVRRFRAGGGPTTIRTNLPIDYALVHFGLLSLDDYIAMALESY